MSGKLVKGMVAGFIVLVICSAWTVHSAAEPPALAKLSGVEKQRVAKLIEGAKKEGELVAYTASWQPPILAWMLPGFRKEYGLSESDLKLNIAVSRTGALVTKVTQELRAKVYRTDFVQTAPTAWFDTLITQNELMAYDGPEFKHFSPRAADPKFGAARPPYYISTHITGSVLLYNPEYIKEEIVHWRDVLRPEYKGKIVVGDVSASFSLTEAYIALRTILDRNFFEELAKQEPLVSKSNADRINKCISGEFPIVVFCVPTLAFRAMEKGANIKIAVPPEGYSLVAYPAAILAHAPHPNAAKLFMDYVHGQEVQQGLLDGGTVSGRIGVKSKYPIYPKQVDKIKGFIEIDWRKISDRDRKEKRAEFDRIMKGRR